MSKRSAGLLMYRIREGELQVFLVHPGGPYWSKKNEGSWTLPKGEYESDEDPLSAAIREFREETGFTVSEPFVELGSVQQKSGKLVAAWAFEGDCDPEGLVAIPARLSGHRAPGNVLRFPKLIREIGFQWSERGRSFVLSRNPFSVSCFNA